MLTCNIVKDLLPNYVDELVSEETAGEIGEHLAGCDACRGIYEQMKTPIEAASFQRDVREVDFMKKIKRNTFRMKIVAGVLAVALVAIGVLAWVFAIGTPVKADNVRIQTEIVPAQGTNNYLEQAWSIRFELKNGKAIVPHKENLYTTGEDGSQIQTGYVISLYEVPATGLFHEDNTYAIGYSVSGQEAPSTDHTITVRLKDGDMVYSMKEEGLFEVQNEPADSEE